MRLINDRLLVAPMAFKVMELFKIIKNGAEVSLIRRIVM